MCLIISLSHKIAKKSIKNRPPCTICQLLIDFYRYQQQNGFSLTTVFYLSCTSTYLPPLPLLAAGDRHRSGVENQIDKSQFIDSTSDSGGGIWPLPGYRTEVLPSPHMPFGALFSRLSAPFLPAFSFSTQTHTHYNKICFPCALRYLLLCAFILRNNQPKQQLQYHHQPPGGAE